MATPDGNSERSDDAAAVREALEQDRREAMERRGTLRGAAVYSRTTRDQTLELARARIRAGAAARAIARELGIGMKTLESWLAPAEVKPRIDIPRPPRLRPGTIIGSPGTEMPAISGPTVVLPSGVRICGLTVDEAAALVKVIG